jgi:hypothetical protein
MAKKKNKNRSASSALAATTATTCGAAAITISSASPAVEASQAAITNACLVGGDHGQLQGWARQATQAEAETKRLHGLLARIKDQTGQIVPKAAEKSIALSSSSVMTAAASMATAATTVLSASPTVEVTKAAIIEACMVGGDHGQLRGWARQGVRVVSWEPLCTAARAGLVHVVLLLVNELGADINPCDKRGCTPVYIAAENRNLAPMRCLEALTSTRAI